MWARPAGLVAFLALVAVGDALQAGSRYSVLIDAGSSGSRIHVFTYAPSTDPANPYGTVQLPEPVSKVIPGLSSYAPDGEGAAESLKPLLDFALAKIPAALHAVTNIRLMATAGLRMLPKNQSDVILERVRGALAGSGFAFQPADALILPGDDEGLYAWTALNYASGKLQALARKQYLAAKGGEVAAPSDDSTFGVFELGGASMQLTFLPNSQLPASVQRNLVIPGVTKPLYTHSFLGYGLDVAWFRAGMAVQQDPKKVDPCLPLGYSTEAGISGGSDFDACAAVALGVLPKSDCSYAACSIAGEFLPPLSGMYLATENFFYTLQKLGLSGSISMVELKAAASRFCGLSWDALRSDYIEKQNIPKEYVMKACFGSAYIYTVLRDAFHIADDDRRITFTNVVSDPNADPASGGHGGVEVNWVLGALLVEEMGEGLAAPLAGSPAKGGSNQSAAASNSNSSDVRAVSGASSSSNLSAAVAVTDSGAPAVTEAGAEGQPAVVVAAVKAESEGAAARADALVTSTSGTEASSQAPGTAEAASKLESATAVAAAAQTAASTEVQPAGVQLPADKEAAVVLAKQQDTEGSSAALTTAGPQPVAGRAGAGDASAEDEESEFERAKREDEDDELELDYEDKVEKQEEEDEEDELHELDLEEDEEEEALEAKTARDKEQRGDGDADATETAEVLAEAGDLADYEEDPDELDDHEPGDGQPTAADSQTADDGGMQKGTAQTRTGKDEEVTVKDRGGKHGSDVLSEDESLAVGWSLGGVSWRQQSMITCGIVVLTLAAAAVALHSDMFGARSNLHSFVVSHAYGRVPAREDSNDVELGRAVAGPGVLAVDGKGGGGRGGVHVIATAGGETGGKRA